MTLFSQKTRHANTARPGAFSRLGSALLGGLILGTLLVMLGIFTTAYAVDAVATPPEDAVKPAAPERMIVINIPARLAFLYESDDLKPADRFDASKLVAWYHVGIGRPGFPTPTGDFKVIRMVKNPGWENPYKAVGVARIKPGASNPLGTRWIGFHKDAKGEYGMHGTNVPSSVGKYASHGCVRMKIKDAEALYAQIAMGIPVQVVYEPVRILRKGDTVELTVYPDGYHRGLPSVTQVIAQINALAPGAVVDRSEISRALAQVAQQQIQVATIPPAGTELDPGATTVTLSEKGEAPTQTASSLQTTNPDLSWCVFCQ